MAVTNVVPFVEGALRAGISAVRNFATALNGCSHLSGSVLGGVIAVFCACGVVLGKAGPRCAWRCLRSNWRASGLVEHGSQNSRCYSVRKHEGLSVTPPSFSLGAQHVIEPGPAESVALSARVASLSGIAAEPVVLSSRRAG